MKKTILIIALCVLSLYSCAQSVNLLATKVSAPAGSLLVVGPNGLFIPLTPPSTNQAIVLSFNNGAYSFMPVPAAALLPAANYGDVLVYQNGQWVGTPATFNIDVTDSTAIAPITLANKVAVKGGAYWIGGYVNIRQTDNLGTVALQYSYTDANGNNVTRLFPAMQAVGNSQYNPVVISCKAGTLITISTVCSNPGMNVVYDTGDVLHELK